MGVLHGGEGGTPYHQTVTAACHHCLEPACMSGCPVDAYEKDASTGIVHHLDDQCIGCGYCTLTCPYEVPRLNQRLGIVRKCDMCAGRLAEGEAPACVAACPSGAIKIGLVDTAVVAAEAVVAEAEGRPTLVAGAPASAITLPTTTYRTAREVPADARGADHHAVAPAQGHPPLAFMLVLTQVAVGAMAWAAAGGPAARAAASVATVLAVVAMAISVAHLGRPRLAWRAVIGLSHSWVSREIAAFGAFAALALAAAALPAAASLLRVGAALAGAGGVACSAMIYAVCHRRWWRAARSLPLFFSTAATGGVAVAVGAAAWTGSRGLVWPAAVGGGVAAGRVAAEAFVRRHRGADTDLGRTAGLLVGVLRRAVRRRIGLTVVGVFVLPLGAAVAPASATGGGVLATGAALLLVAADLIERHLFFTAATGPRMPGGFR